MSIFTSIILLFSAYLALTAGQRIFSIDYENDTFLMDGEPFRYVSGSVHYFRMPNQYWRDILRKLRAAGLNAVSTYVEWSSHEKIPGEYDFDGDLDLEKFITTAQEEGLYVILRVGPYVCAERDMGGFPFWLLSKYPDIQLRTLDKNFVYEVEKWLSVLLPRIVPLMIIYGGPVITIQVENEYSLSGHCDNGYKDWLRDVFLKYTEDRVLLFTTDNIQLARVKCSKINGVLSTVDFKPSVTNMTEAFSGLRQVEPHGPLVNSEYYTGWLTHWGERKPSTSTDIIVSTLVSMLDIGANVNFYMFYGGTNFGFTAGANDPYLSEITSYDYDAPLTEAGDPTEKFWAIRDTLRKYMQVPDIPVQVQPKGDYGTITLHATAEMNNPITRQYLAGDIIQTRYPLSFESVWQNSGYIIYETVVPTSVTGNMEIQVSKINDVANVYINNNWVKTLSREFLVNTATAYVDGGETLSIIAENLGRINIGSIHDFKGILSNVTLGGEILENWKMTKYELNNIVGLESCFYQGINCINLNNLNSTGYIFYMARFKIKQELLDTYINVSNLSKGVVFINNFNLGRYWSSRGPQLSLYVPGVYLKQAPEENVLVIMDEYLKNEEITVDFVQELMWK